MAFRTSSQITHDGMHVHVNTIAISTVTAARACYWRKGEIRCNNPTLKKKYGPYEIKTEQKPELCS